jgi:carboxypeptidase T
MHSGISRLLLALLLGLLTLSPAAAQPSPEPDRILVELRPPAGPELARLDVWEADAERALALVFADEAAALERAGYSLTERRRFPGGRRALAAQFGPGGYKGHDAVVAELQAIAAAYPAVATQSEIGRTREQRPIRALRITAGSASKPAAVYLAAYHAREVATPELALRAARYFASAYGRDPLVTYLLDTRELWVVPLVNADGYTRVEAGAEWWRKNAAPGACAGQGRPDNASHPGVDLNRNHAYAWDPPNGASTSPCDETYRGPAAASEPETQAVQRLVESLSATALISWHSYGNLVLWPPTSRADPNPAAADPLLAALGGRLAGRTGYAGGTGGASLYLTTGELTEWAWYARRVAAFTIEVGRYEDGLGGNPFTPPYRTVERYWHENQPAALYLARVADDPARATAPDPTALTATLPFGAATASATAAISAGAAGPAAAVELFVGQPGAEGAGQAGRIDAGGARATWSVAVASLPAGRHTLWARARAASGPWGPLAATTVLVGRQNLLFPALAQAGRLD